MDELRAPGHVAAPIGPWESGGTVQLIGRDAGSDLYRGATDSRRPGQPGARVLGTSTP